MRFGLHAIGVGTGADPAVIAAVARAADESGFATLWSGEHVVMVDRPDALYPYSDDGKIAVPTDTDWLDPLVGLSYVAALTTRIRLATGILLLPQHNPLVVAKQTASLDVLSRGRFVLGVGIGWSSEEFAAVGVAFDGRAARTIEYLDVLRAVWRDDVSVYSGEFVRFDAVRSYPKPIRGRRIPVVLGGNSDAALDRVADHGEGWYGFNVPRRQVVDRVGYLTERCRQAGRDVADLDVVVALLDGTPDDVPAMSAAGVTELVVVDAPPGDPGAAVAWVRELAAQWGVGT